MKAQSLVELAVAFVVIMLLLAGIMEFGVALMQFVQLRDAVQEGALYGSINPSDTFGIEDHVRAESEFAFDPATETERRKSYFPVDLSDPSVIVTISATDKDGNPKDAASACQGDHLKVAASYNHQIFMPFLSSAVGNTIPLRASVTNTVLRPRCAP